MDLFQGPLTLGVSVFRLVGFPFICQWDGAVSQGLASWLHDL